MPQRYNERELTCRRAKREVPMLDFISSLIKTALDLLGLNDKELAPIPVKADRHPQHRR